MSSSAMEIETSIEDAEALETLVARAHKRTGKIPTEVVARHVQSIVPASEWPVRVEAMDALLRRIEAGREEKLRVEARSARRPMAGALVQRGGRARARGRTGPC